MGNIKQFLQNRLVSVREKKYNECYEKHIITYDMWIKKQEEKERERANERSLHASAASVELVTYEECSSLLTEQWAEWKKGNGKKETIFICTAPDGRLADGAASSILEYFLEHPSVMLIYGDEDVESPDGIRYMPWFKPDWSPDTFLTGFYFGSIFALRSRAVWEVLQEGFCFQKEADVSDNLYRLCLTIAKKSGGYLKRKSMEFPVGHIDRILFHGKYSRELKCNTTTEPYLTRNKKRPDGKITVVIPSKDNPDTLIQCIESLTCGLAEGDQVIVVDNGSRPENKEQIASYLEKRKMCYLYEPMPFHFSAMCNLGAEQANNEVLLFLNDDVEIGMEPGSLLDALYQQAILPYTGAVGVKLLYPDSNKIQHAGICSQHLGPVHKLQFQEDNRSYYYDFNKGRRNVLAVTGACLAVEKEKFKEAGGFCMELAHSFNDVDLCFTLYEKGYYQTVLQEVRVFHHESLSRGGADDIQKNNRLYGEKKILYHRHSLLSLGDPFYHRNLVQDVLSTGFEPAAQYEYVSLAANSKTCPVKRIASLPKRSREDACVMPGIEFAGTMAEWAGTGSGYYVQGYVFVAGSNNARYEKQLLLRGEGTLWSLRPVSLLRQDVEENLKDQLNVGLAGFAARISGKELKAGNYEIGLLLRDCCTGYCLVQFTKRLLNIK